jgi:gas vesicle protein
MTSLYLNDQSETGPRGKRRARGRKRERGTGRFVKQQQQQQQRRPLMATRDFIESGISLIGGIGIGAALMYLFDPETGTTRRSYLREAAADALERAGETAGTAYESLAEGTSGLRESTISRLRDYVPSQREASGALSRVRKSLSRSGSDWADRGRDLAERGRQYLPGLRDESPSPATIALTAVGCCAVGAALMFVMDPAAGRRRRALLRDKTTSYARRGSEAIGKQARHMSNVAKGAYHEASSAVTNAVGGGQMSGNPSSGAGASNTGQKSGSRADEAEGGPVVVEETIIGVFTPPTDE